MTDTSTITDADLFAGWLETPEEWGGYHGPIFENEVAAVVERITEIHEDRDLPYRFEFRWSGELEGVVSGAAVMVRIEHEDAGLYLCTHLPLNRGLTTSLSATGVESARAIRDALMAAYDKVAKYALADGDDVRGCSCGMADYGAPGHDGGDPA